MQLKWLLGLFIAFSANADTDHELSLREKYASSPENWPSVVTTDNRKVPELAPLPPLVDPPTAELVALGDKLFHDTILSKDNTVSCASCHEARLVFTDLRKQAVGISQQVGKRNTPTIVGIDLWDSFFWDGRAKTAQQQALMPIVDPKEMNATIPGALTRLRESDDYLAEFKQVFPGEGITAQTLSKAIVAFERTIKPPQSRFMTFIEQAYQTPKSAVDILSVQELLGLHLFRTKARCMTCHNGPLMSDNQFHVTGFHYYQRKYHDGGRFDITGRSADSGAFRTPSLWAVSKTGPWFHNGIMSSLSGIIGQYNAGGPRPKPKEHQLDDPNFPKTTDLLVKLELTKEEREALEAFLKML
tara:strand:+ start:3873 stop:4946 length:1074 start_codon:yes stop_codon:yes gene_type:complete